MDSAPDSWKEGETTEGDTSMEGDTSISVIIALEISGLWGFESLGGYFQLPFEETHMMHKLCQK